MRAIDESSDVCQRVKIGDGVPFGSSSSQPAKEAGVHRQVYMCVCVYIMYAHPE